MATGDVEFGAGGGSGAGGDAYNIKKEVLGSKIVVVSE